MQIKKSTLTKPIYRPMDLAEMYAVTVQTIRNWEQRGILLFSRDPVTNRRYLTKEQVIELLERDGKLVDDSEDKVDVIYILSSSEEKERETEARFNSIQSGFALNSPVVIKDIGSNMDDKRKGLNELLLMMKRGEIGRVFLTHKDNLLSSKQPGQIFLNSLFEAYDVELVVLPIG